MLTAISEAVMNWLRDLYGAYCAASPIASFIIIIFLGGIAGSIFPGGFFGLGKYLFQKEQTAIAAKAAVAAKEVPHAPIINVTSFGQSGGITAQTVIQSDKFRPLKERLIDCLNRIDPTVVPRRRAGMKTFQGLIPQYLLTELQQLAAEDSGGKYIILSIGGGIALGGPQGGSGPRVDASFELKDTLIE